MSEFVQVVVNVIGTRKADVMAFAASVASSKSPLVGSRVNRRWTSAAIEDVHFELIDHFERWREQWPKKERSFADTLLNQASKQGKSLTCAHYAFGSRGFGGGVGDYFRDASKRHPELHFVECWLYPDKGIGEIGLQEFAAGELLRQEVYHLDDDVERFKRLAWEWLSWTLPDDYPLEEE